MDAEKIREVTAEGTNAGGDELEAASAGKAATKEAEAPQVIAGLVEKARTAMQVFMGYDQERVNEVVQAVA